MSRFLSHLTSLRFNIRLLYVLAPLGAAGTIIPQRNPVDFVHGPDGGVRLSSRAREEGGERLCYVGRCAGRALVAAPLRTTKGQS